VVQKLVKADEAESELAKLAQQKANNGELKDSLRRSFKVTKGEVISVTISDQRKWNGASGRMRQGRLIDVLIFPSPTDWSDEN